MCILFLRDVLYFKFLHPLAQKMLPTWKWFLNLFEKDIWVNVRKKYELILSCYVNGKSFSCIFFWFISEWSSKLFTFFFSERKYSIIWPLHKNVSYLNNLDGCCCCKYHTIIPLFNLSDCIAIYILLRLVISQKYCQIWIDIVNQSFEWWFMIS